MLDINFLEMSKKVDLNFDQREQLDCIIKKDSEFLGGHGFIDYSLLLVREPISFPVKSSSRNIFASKTMAYHFGIIDFLQDWSFEKRIEAWWKSFKVSREHLSALEPDKYSERFYKFVSQQVLEEP